MNNVVWKEIRGYEDYEISNTGLVRRGCKILNPSNNSKGYLRVGLSKNGKTTCLYIHRLVAIAFLDKDDDKDIVDHINGIRGDNRVENLRWCTIQENLTFPLAKENRSRSQINVWRNDEYRKRMCAIAKEVRSNKEYRENMSRLKKDFYKTHKPYNITPICRYSDDLILEKEYDTISEVANDGYDPSFVCKVCRGKKSKAYGKIWKYKL